MSPKTRENTPFSFDSIFNPSGKIKMIIFFLKIIFNFLIINLNCIIISINFILIF